MRMMDHGAIYLLIAGPTPLHARRVRGPGDGRCSASSGRSRRGRGLQVHRRVPIRSAVDCPVSRHGMGLHHRRPPLVAAVRCRCSHGCGRRPPLFPASASTPRDACATRTQSGICSCSGAASAICRRAVEHGLKARQLMSTSQPQSTIRRVSTCARVFVLGWYEGLVPCGVTLRRVFFPP